METLYTRRNSHFDVNIICVPEYFCHPVGLALVPVLNNPHEPRRETQELWREMTEDVHPPVSDEGFRYETPVEQLLKREPVDRWEKIIDDNIINFILVPESGGNSFLLLREALVRLDVQLLLEVIHRELGVGHVFPVERDPRSRTLVRALRHRDVRHIPE